MEKEEVLEKVKAKKVVIGEMERVKINKANWISLVVTGIVAVVLMIIEGALGHFTSIYAIATVCFTWASIFYFCQYFIAKRPWQVLIGAILEALGAITMVTLYILFSIGVL